MTKSKKVCTHCNDTHYVPAPEDQSGPFGDGTWMCTRCPTPCQKCRAGGTGAYCEKTPCACQCHADKAYPMHAKTRENQAELFRFGEFLEFLERTDRLNRDGTQAQMKFENILGEFFEIDPKELSREKDRMADEASRVYETNEKRKKGVSRVDT